MSKPPSPRHYNVLLVEDHPADVALTKKAFARLTTPTTLYVALDGVEAMAFLHQEGRYETAPRPDIILLDLNMPRRDGRAVLRDVKADPALRSIPIIVLTTSAAAQDVLHAYALHANGYVAKPIAFDDFVSVVQSLDRFWFATAILL